MSGVRSQESGVRSTTLSSLCDNSMNDNQLINILIGIAFLLVIRSLRRGGGG